jgi:hypothetical protein
MFYEIRSCYCHSNNGDVIYQLNYILFSSVDIWAFQAACAAVILPILLKCRGFANYDDSVIDFTTVTIYIKG